MEAVMKLDIDTFLELIGRASTEERDKLLHDEWCSLLPFMYSGFLKLMSFSEYIDRRTGRNIDWRPAEVLLEEFDEIERRFAEHEHI